jgi:SAM-dependent methyltransferase
MDIAECRVCGGSYFTEPLLSFSGMPRSAQGFPDAGTVDADTGTDLVLWQCAGCGLAQLRSEPVKYYRDVIRAAGVSDVVRRAKARQFEEFVERYALGGGRVLEVGCGHGEFLEVLQTTSVEAYGMEHAAPAVEDCRRRGLRVDHGYPGEGVNAWAGGPYDGFLLLMFLEHMPEPRRALRALRENLRDGAVGLVEVPSLDFVLTNALYSEFIADHLLYFTARTLRTTLELSGFDVLSSSGVRDDYVISATVRRRRRLDMSGFAARQAEVTAQLRAFVARFPADRCAVWGAGHQGLAAMALAGIGDRIRYVVDSAPFKQGRFTPATHIPIVPPETLASDPVDAVIVMAASYSDEVVAILRERFGPDLAVAVLRASGLDVS